jgi:predicted AlkP superfamily pyrophosphatase or phosphodiesterase
VVLISFDGTRVTEVEGLPAFRRIAARGVAATALRPVFPTNTFPNHVSLVTGVEPARHGIVNNSFRDPERGSFRYESDPTWIEVEPLWSLVAEAGLNSASFHWVGSEGPWRSGRGPEEWRGFDGRVREIAKVRQIIEWLERPAPERPALISAWFRGADGAGHRDGPDTEATRRTLRKQDEALGELLDFLDRDGRWPATTLLVVSDHGMAAVEKRVDLAAAIEASGARATLRGGGGFGTVTLHRGKDRKVRIDKILGVARGLGLKAWPRGEGPSDLDDRHPRFGDVLVLAPVGTGFSREGGVGGRVIAKTALNGSHGYRPGKASMQAMISAAGRGVTPGVTLEGARAIDVAPTVLELLGVPAPAWMEGRALPLGPVP